MCVAASLVLCDICVRGFECVRVHLRVCACLCVRMRVCACAWVRLCTHAFVSAHVRVFLHFYRQAFRACVLDVCV